MAGWSFTASGLAKGADVIRRIGDEVAEVLAVPETGTEGHTVSGTAGGWGVEANGATDDAQVHHWLAERLKSIISSADAQTGHSTFTSPYVQLTNFHAPAPPAGAAPPAAGPAATPEPQGAGGAAGAG